MILAVGRGVCATEDKKSRQLDKDKERLVYLKAQKCILVLPTGVGGGDLAF